jgi:hypothetical protein
MINEKAKYWLREEIFIKAGLMILLFFAPLVFYPYNTTFHFTKNTVIEIIISLIGGFWLIKQLEKKEDTLLKSPLNLPILIFFTTILISLFQTNSLYDSLNELALWGSYFFVYFIVISLIKDKRWIYILLKIVILSGDLLHISVLWS